ncbi:MAG: hypothetical protein KAR33_10295 [Candidatus Thorarchaeota archaeon]|nr:hypothetical protein [Candidatus Thorarchaeota archaeon]
MREVWVMVIIVALFFTSPSQPNQTTIIETASDDTLFELIYTSRDRHDYTILQDGDTAWGDHVLLNATFFLLTENVTWSRLTILTLDEDNITIVEENRTIMYDTYLIGKNATASIQYEVQIENGTQYFLHYDSLTFANYFKPYINTINVAGASAVKSITWSCSDLNNQDDHIFDLFITYQGATRWWLLASNLTSPTYDWETIFYASTTWKLKVVVYDNDTSYRPDYVNQNLWPGLTDEFESVPFSGSGWSFFTSLPGWNVTVFLFEGGNYTEGEIVWYKRVSMFDAFPDHSLANYSIYQNGTLVKLGVIDHGTISISVVGLAPGIYNYTINIVHKEHSASDTVFITVYAQVFEYSNWTLDQWGLLATVVSLFGMISCAVCSKWRHKYPEEISHST